MTATIKHGDTAPPITITLGAPLDPSDGVQVLARRIGGEVVELVVARDDDEGVLTHTPTGLLPEGDYSFEVKVTRNETLQSVPSVGFGRFTVAPSL